MPERHTSPDERAGGKENDDELKGWITVHTTPNVAASQVRISAPQSQYQKPTRSSPLNGREARFYSPILGRQWIAACRDLSRLFDLLDSFGRKSGKVYPKVSTMADILGWWPWRVHKRLRHLETMDLLSPGRLVHEHGPRLRVLHPEKLKAKTLPAWPRELRPSEINRANVESDIPAPEIQVDQHVESHIPGHVGPDISATSSSIQPISEGSAVRNDKSKAAAERRTASAAWKRLSEPERQEHILRLIWENDFNENYPTTLSEIARLAGLHRRVKPVLVSLSNPDYPDGLYVSGHGKRQVYFPLRPEHPDWDEYYACGDYEAA